MAKARTRLALAVGVARVFVCGAQSTIRRRPAVCGVWAACFGAARRRPLPAEAGRQSEPGLVFDVSGGGLFPADADRLAQDARTRVVRVPMPRCCFVVEVGAVTDNAHSSAPTPRDLIAERHALGVAIVFARVPRIYLATTRANGRDKACVRTAGGSAKGLDSLSALLSAARNTPYQAKPCQQHGVRFWFWNGYGNLRGKTGAVVIVVPI